MGTIASSGVGSGLDIAGLVQKLVEAEGGPKTLRLDQQEAKVQAKLSALGTLRSALVTFRNSVTVLKSIDQFQGRQVTVSTADFVSATADTAATPGSYAVEVQQLAGAHKLQSGTYAATTDVVGTGALQIVTGGETFVIDIGAENDTLAGIAAAINSSPAGEKVVATVIAGTGEARLTLTARNTGAANAMTITQSGGDGGLAALEFPPSGTGLVQLTAARDASVLVEGVLATSGTNDISGVIAGVTLSLEAENAPGETTLISVGYDRAAARKSIDAFVNGYNALVEAIKSVASYNVDTRQGGPLFGDAGVRNIVYQLRRELTGTVSGASGPFDMLADIGISADLDGKLSIDSADLDAAFATDFDGVGELFAAADDGVAVKLDAMLEPYLKFEGVFDSRTTSLKTSIEDITDQRKALETRLAALQARYTRQFNALDSLLAQLQSTSNFLSQQLSTLPGSGVLLHGNDG